MQYWPSFFPNRDFVLWTLALLLAGGGQILLATGERMALGAAALFLLALFPAWFAWGSKPLTTGQSPPVPARPRFWALSLALLLAAVAWIGSGGNTFRWWGVLTWIGSLALWLFGWRVEQRTDEPATVREPLRSWQLVLFVLILIAATWFRFWQIDVLPPEMTSDHAEKLLDIRDVLEGQRPIFFTRNTGREPLQFYLTALIAGPLGFGLSHLALKVGTAFISLLTVPLTYLVARRGLGLPRTFSLIAMALITASKWHVSISRVGLRFPYAPFGVALTLIFFYRALRLGTRRDWLLAGAAFGIALYGYTAVRILPLLFVLGALLWFFEQLRRPDRLPWATVVTNILLLPVTSFLVFLPLFRYSLEKPEMFWYRSASRTGPLEGSLFSAFLLNVRNAMLMFHVRGDAVWVNTLPFDPVLDRVTGALYLLGVGVILLTALRWRRAVELTFLLSLPVLLLPSILALAWPRENPSVVRTGGALPVVMIMAALPLYNWLRTLAAHPADRKVAGQPAVINRLWSGLRALFHPAMVLIILLLSTIVLNARIYFGPYEAQYYERSWNTTEVAEAILAHEAQIGGIDHAFVKSYPHWVDTRNVAFNMGDSRWDSVLRNIEEIEETAKLPAEPRLMIFHPDDRQALAYLQREWQGAEVERYDSQVPGKDFIIVTHPDYTVP